MKKEFIAMINGRKAHPEITLPTKQGDAIDVNRVNMVNNSMSFDCIVNKGRGSIEFKAKIASEVHPVTNVVGLDLMDGCPLLYLAHINDIYVINRD